MPKKKHTVTDLSVITKKLRKIEKKLKRTKAHRKRVISTSSEDSLHSPVEPNSGENRNFNESILSENYDTLDTHVTMAIPPVATLDDDVIMAIPPAANTSGDEAANAITEITDTAGIELMEENLTLNSELLDILGDDPTLVVEFGKNVRTEVACRFEHIATSGLNKELRKELCDKYLIPGNCSKIGAPALNLEVKAALSEPLLKRDKFLEARQCRIAAAISCLASVLTSELESNEKNNDLLKHLMDASRLLCDVQHDESLVRRNFAISSLKKEMKDSLYNTKIDKYLFGENLVESLKVAKAVTKSGSELKSNNNLNNNKNITLRQKNNLNWKAPVAARRQPPIPRSTAPAAAAAQGWSPYPYRYPAPPPPPPPPAPPQRGVRFTSSRPPPPQRSTRRR